MKNLPKFIYILFLLLFVCACSIEDALENESRLPFQALSMQILEAEPIIAKDTSFYPIFVSSPNNEIVKFSVEHLSDFEGFISQTKVFVSDSVTVDENGEFSRPISSALIKYPVVGSSVPGEILSAVFTFTDDQGQTATVTANKKVVNFKTNSSLEFLFGSRPLHSFYDGKSYSAGVVDDNITFRDSLDVFWARIDGIQYLASPDSDFTAQQFAIDYPTVNYEQSTMQDVKLVKLNIPLLEVNDDVFENMDFSQGVDVIETEDGAVYGVLLEDGRKAAIETNVYSTVYGRVRSVVQVSAN